MFNKIQGIILLAPCFERMNHSKLREMNCKQVNYESFAGKICFQTETTFVSKVGELN